MAIAATLSLTLLGALACTPLARAGETGASGEWVSAPALAPPPPPGVTDAPFSIGLGQIGQISFFSPDHGLLITGGTELLGNGTRLVEPGLYAYDGRDWHQLATVCGGETGRIAWESEDAFWTIADQREGQLLKPGTPTGALRALSLCHFVDGQVVGSYAMPLEQEDSYEPMDAAACLGPEDCWFGGEDKPNAGAFQLHWNGSTLTAMTEPEDHAVSSMADFEGEIFEGVTLAPSDSYLGTEDAEHPAVIHSISSTGESPFEELNLFSSAFKPLPEYGKGVLPDAIEGLYLTTDGSPLGEGATQMWAAADPIETAPPGSGQGAVTILHELDGSWTQVAPKPEKKSGISKPGAPTPPEAQPPEAQLLPPGWALGGAQSTSTTPQAHSEDLAPEPGSEDAWLSFGELGESEAHVEEIGPTGTILRGPETLPSGEETEPIGLKGGPGPITCPAAEDCWLATEGSGWLFHLTNGTLGPIDEDPYFAGVINSRPPDQGIPVSYTEEEAEDDALANQQAAPPAPTPPAPEVTPLPPTSKTSGPTTSKAKPIATHVKSRVIHHRTLRLSFTLTARARVQLIGRRGKKVVAKTRAKTMKIGRHHLSLRLNPKRWPKKLQFKATPVGKQPAKAGGAGTDEEEVAGGEDTVTTG